MHAAFGHARYGGLGLWLVDQQRMRLTSPLIWRNAPSINGRPNLGLFLSTLKYNLRLLLNVTSCSVATGAELMDIISKYVSEICSFVAGLAGGSLLTLRFTRKTKVGSKRSNGNQSGASAGGDLVGRDKIAGRDQR